MTQPTFFDEPSLLHWGYPQEMVTTLLALQQLRRDQATIDSILQASNFLNDLLVLGFPNLPIGARWDDRMHAHHELNMVAAWAIIGDRPRVFSHLEAALARFAKV